MSGLISSAAAIHAFVLPTDFSSDSQITTLPLSHPVLDFTILPSNQLLVSLDPAFGVFTQNQTGLPPVKGKAAEAAISPEQSSEMSNSTILLEVGSGASVSPYKLLSNNELTFSSIAHLRLSSLPSDPSLHIPPMPSCPRRFPPCNSTQTYRFSLDGLDLKRTTN